MQRRKATGRGKIRRRGAATSRAYCQSAASLRAVTNAAMDYREAPAFFVWLRNSDAIEAMALEFAI